VNYDNSLVVTITVTCYSWAPSSGDHLFTSGAISRQPQYPFRILTDEHVPLKLLMTKYFLMIFHRYI